MSVLKKYMAESNVSALLVFLEVRDCAIEAHSWSSHSATGCVNTFSHTFGLHCV